MPTDITYQWAFTSALHRWPRFGILSTWRKSCIGKIMCGSRICFWSDDLQLPDRKAAVCQRRKAVTFEVAHWEGERVIDANDRWRAAVQLLHKPCREPAPGPVLLRSSRRQDFLRLLLTEGLVNPQSLEARLCGLGSRIVDADCAGEAAQRIGHWKLARKLVAVSETCASRGGRSSNAFAAPANS